MNTERAMELWEKHFGDVRVAFDYTGRELYKHKYNELKKDFCWVVDYSIPLTNGGADEYYNCLPVSPATRNAKGDKSMFYTNNKKYRVISFRNMRKHHPDKYPGKGYAYLQDDTNDVMAITIK